MFKKTDEDEVIKDNTKYIYDENNNIKVKYTYDEFSRLIREDNKELNKTFIYFYDNGGDITEKLEAAYTLTNYENIIKENVTEKGNIFQYGFIIRKSFITKYGYTATGSKKLLISFDNEKFEYDDLGYPTIYRSTAFQWNQLGNLEKIGSVATYKYNESGIRISKIVDNQETRFYLSGNKIIAQEIVSLEESENSMIDTILFHYGVDGLVSFNLNGTEYFYKKNIFGDIIGIYDNSGKEIIKYAYDALGNHKTFVLNDEQFVDIANQITYTKSGLDFMTIALLNPFRYRSYYFDEETGLYYINSRYYDPETGRFIS